MSLNSPSKYEKQYYKHVLEDKRAEGNLAKVFDIITDLTNRRGLRQEWENIDGEIQDEIIKKWLTILNN